ncbi:MAG: glycine cleavage system aminomethyltransferase GcvT [Pirellulaceae bacterium]|nr:glycine cleavage system aminomethyltransferase GcvT [Pirellulaceae bacterium]
MTCSLAETPLHAWHVAHGGKMVDFAGWSMPVQYGSITTEHLATRQHASLFDVSHMGRLRFDGKDAAKFLDRLTTRRVSDLSPGRIRYSLMTQDDGGILDDVLVYHLQQPDQSSFYGLVVNASNRQKITDWIRQHQPRDLDVSWIDQTLHSAMIAIQGPQALAIAEQVIKTDLRALKYFSGQMISVNGQGWVVSRTGYTGEDGVELVVPSEAAVDLWSQLMTAGKSLGLVAAGLGARDTLRLEAAMPLYGHELTDQINPIQAGLPFAINLKGRQFPGHDAIQRETNDPSLPVRIGLKLAGKRVPRQHYPVVDKSNHPIGEVTSGTFSPTLQHPIAMAYVQPDHATVGTKLAIDIRGRQESAEVVALPFYQRS